MSRCGLWRNLFPQLCSDGGGCAHAAAAAFTSAQISEDDQFLFCGTTSGDIMKINLKTRLLSDYGPKRFSAKHSQVGPPALFCSLTFVACFIFESCCGQSVSALRMLQNGNLLVGSGCGKLMLCSATGFRALK